LVNELHPGLLEASVKVQLLAFGSGLLVARVLGLEMVLKCTSAREPVPKERAALDCAWTKVAFGAGEPMSFVNA
jgi:hypothetical protein